MKKQLVFLGGTCGKNDWRLALIAALVAQGVSSDCLFNPVVPNWNDAAQAAEEKAKAEASHMLFYVADPKQEGNPISAYSILEAAMALYDKSKNSVVVFDTTGMTGHALKAMDQSAKVLKKRFPEARIFTEVSAAQEWLVKTLTDVDDVVEVQEPAGATA